MESTNLTQANKTQALVLILSLLVIAGFGASVYFYTQYQKSQQLFNNPGLASQLQIQDTTKKISVLMTLPTDEQPTIATVADVTKLKDQVFFKNAKNGDKVLIYTKNRKAILYSVGMNKILDVEPININANNTPAPVRIAVYNGSVNGDSTQSFEDQLKSKANNVNFVKTQKASGNYGRSQVVDTSGGQFSSAATQLAQLIGADVVQLPAGEQKPDADLLVILGTNGFTFANVPNTQPTAVPTTAVQVTTAPSIAPSAAVTAAPTH